MPASKRRGKPDNLKAVVGGLPSGLGEELLRVPTTHRPDIVEVNVSLSLSKKLNTWVIVFEGTQTLSVTPTWRTPPPKELPPVRRARR